MVVQTFTENDIKNPVYSDGILNVVGVSTYLVSSSRNSDGTLNDNSINNIIQILNKQHIIPIIDISKDPSIFTLKSKTFNNTVKNEYSFYEDRYISSLDTFFSTMIATNVDQNKAKRYLGYSKLLNTHLNDIIQIIDGINKYLMEQSSELDNETIEYLSIIKKKKIEIEKQKKILASTDLETKIKKQMVKYTTEKGAYSERLLKLYSFLNIVALGLLVYIYKAVQEE